jgi:two-component system sensor histidine kinase DesK
MGGVGAVVTVVAGAVSVHRDGWGGLGTAYATWISTRVTPTPTPAQTAVIRARFPKRTQRNR